MVKLFLIILYFVSHRAQAISQVGPKSIGSTVDRFSLSLPLRFPQISQLPNSELKVQESISTNDSLVQTTYYFLPFSNVYSFDGWAKNDITNWFDDEGWLEVISEDCRVSYMKLTKSSVKGISTWGQRRGLMIIGQRSQWVQRHILLMLQDVKLQTNACAWESSGDR